MILCILVLSLVASGVAQAVPQAVQDVVTLREAAVTKIATDAKNAFNRRCSSSVRSCSTCSPDACTNAAKDYSCNKGFGTPPLCAADSGRKLNPGLSTVRVPPGVSTSSAEVKEDICYTLPVEQAFKENLAADSTTKWQYFATTAGMHRTFPSRAWTTTDGQCNYYDPRERPWFVAASSGPKNVILVIDKSGSMTQETPTRWEQAVAAAKAVISALGSSDYLGVVLFSSQGATQQWATNLQAATSSNKNSAIGWLDRQSASGGTYFSEGFSATIDMLQRSRTAEVYTPCQTVVLFLTDGRASESATSSPSLADVRSQADAIANDYNGTLFTFSFGSGADASFPKDLACRANGLWSGISSSGNLRTQMLGYYRFLAATRADESVVWSEPFQDATGLGEIVTAARAVFEVPSGGGIALLVGVAGVDVKLSDVQAAGADRSSFLRYIASKSSRCAEVSPSFCELQRLRELQSTSARCPDRAGLTCPSINVEERTTCGTGISASSATCSADTQTSLNEGEAQCCEGAAPLNAVTIGGIVAGAVIGVCLCVCAARLVSSRRAAAAAAARKPPGTGSAGASGTAARERHDLGSRAAHVTAVAPPPPAARAPPHEGAAYPGAGAAIPSVPNGAPPHPGSGAPQYPPNHGHASGVML